MYRISIVRTFSGKQYEDCPRNSTTSGLKIVSGYVKGKKSQIWSNLWWNSRIFGGEVDVELKDAACVGSVLGTGDHRLEQRGLLVVTSGKSRMKSF